MTYREALFEGASVIVLGGTSGIGAATALAFAALGADVIAAGLGANGNDAPRHARVQVLELDVTDSTALERALSGLHSLNALVLDVNLTSMMRACNAAMPRLIHARGCIVNVASMFSTFGSADRPAYAASKGGVVQLTRSLAQAYAPAKVRVNAVAPGWIVTPLSAGLRADEAASRKILDRTPLGEWGRPSDIADAIVFLCSPAARYVTGATLPVDGGYLTM